MALKDRSRTTPQPVVHGAPCSIGEAYRRNLADAAELAEIHAVLYHEGRSAQSALDELKGAGYEVAYTAIRKHRGGNCRCFNIDRDFCPTCKCHLAAHISCEQAA